MPQYRRPIARILNEKCEKCGHEVEYHGEWDFNDGLGCRHLEGYARAFCCGCKDLTVFGQG